MNAPTRQTGVALLTVLLIMALCSLIAVKLMEAQQLSLQRTTLLLHQQQARNYALGVEQWATSILRRDRQDNAVDHSNEAWARKGVVLPIDGGQISGQIEDLQGCFNLRNLVSDTGTLDASQFKLLQRLLERLELNPELAYALADWVDSDSDTSSGAGAEDGYYLSLNPPYLAANQAPSELSELRLVRGIDSKVYALLRPVLCSLPERTRLNVNTLRPALLSALSSASESDNSARPSQGFAQVSEFINRFPLLDRTFSAENLSVSSEYFRVRIQVLLGDYQVLLTSVLQRNAKGEIQVLQRSYAED